MPQENKTKTLFVKNLDRTLTSSQLEDHFSEYGPLLKAFIVNEKGSKKSRGFGYVTFALKEDCDRALSQCKQIGGRKIQSSLALKRPSQEERKGDVPKQKPASVIYNKKNQTKRYRLIIRNLDFKVEQPDLQKLFKPFGEILEVHIPCWSGGRKRGFGFVEFKDPKAAVKALNKVNKSEVMGRPVAVDWALEKGKFEKTGEDEDEDSDEADEPEDTAEKEELEEEDEEMEIDEDSDEGSADEDEFDSEESSDDETDAEENDDNDDGDDDDTWLFGSKAKVNKQKNQSENGKAVKDKQKSGQSKDKKEKTQKQGKKTEENGSKNRKKINPEEKSQSLSEKVKRKMDSEDEQDDTEEEESEEQLDSDDEMERRQAWKQKKNSDVDQGKTVFIRNVPFDAEDDDIEDVFSQFGQLVYALVVMDHATGHSKGTAFVKFKDKASLDACLQAAKDIDRAQELSLKGRPLSVTLALSKERAKEVQKPEEDRSDNRNLWLAREGLIRSGTKAAAGLPEADVKKRAKVEAVKRQKLKNPDIFVSSVRLCLHNLPLTLKDAELKKICIKAGSQGAKVTECRIMRDLQNVNAQGVARSRGYAFVSFKEHKNAMKALHHLNNNQELFGPNRRPIVEFSLENRIALQTKEKRREKQQQTIQLSKSENKNSKVKKEKEKKFKVATVPRPANTPKFLPSHSGAKKRHKKNAQKSGPSKKKFKKS